MLAIVQARFSSRRLPGKVLRQLAGKPLLAWLLARISAAQCVSKCVVATSIDPSDDAVVQFCKESGIAWFRGSLKDVASRLLATAEHHGADAFVRISGDSPFILPSLIDTVVSRFELERPDLATNVQQRTFPKGLSVEAIRTASLRIACEIMQPGEAEHVTPVFYRSSAKFRILNVHSGQEWGAIQMSVDTEDDFVIAERMMRAAPGAWMTMDLEGLLALRERSLMRTGS